MSGTMIADADRAPDSPENPHAGFGSVILDIGGDVGALVVTMPEAWVGQEVEIASLDGHHVDHSHDGHPDDGHSHDDGGGHRPHVAVVRRPVSEGELVPSLVFPALTSGRYQLFPKGGDQAVMEASVEGGAVTEEVWPQEVWSQEVGPE